MTIEEAVAQLDGLSGGDPESAHSIADNVLKEMVPPEVRAAYDRLVERCSWWACA